MTANDRPPSRAPSRRGAFSWRRLRALSWKETLQIVRDPSSIAIAFVLPVVLLLIFGFGINLDTSRLGIGVVMEDGGAPARRFAMAIEGSPYVRPVIGASRQEMQTRMDAGEIRGIIVVPADFSRKVLRGHGGAVIQVIADGAEPNTANFVASYAQGILQRWLAADPRGLAGPASAGITLEPRYWFNPTTVSRNYLIPGSISVIMTIIGALLTSLVVAREWERGTMEALLAAPITRTELLLSKILPYYVLGMVALVICVLIATLLMDVPMRGSMLVLFVPASLFLGSALGLGLLLSTVTRDQFDAAQSALNAAFLPAALLSGFIFEIGSMPAVVQAVTYLVPARYFVSILQTLFQAGHIWPVIWLNTLFLLLSAIFWLGFTALKTRRRLDG
ncbi:ABC transporter permease [Pollutimonas bauzanensis]|uniref:ABC-2 type transport system permease protein n=1 Tax=Pollutimonas bauzanensis TaxID=658167 RepID=A0A1M6A9M3_9BURK|nr:ABC transporter permease [Pollutimonas bauzanensis]SHI32853.1 ABC-2 type transport system permease protein [Pollutimonas bauzanensis]